MYTSISRYASRVIDRASATDTCINAKSNPSVSMTFKKIHINYFVSNFTNENVMKTYVYVNKKVDIRKNRTIYNFGFIKIIVVHQGSYYSIYYVYPLFFSIETGSFS